MTSLRTRVSAEVRRMILAGQLHPGERLLQQQLAKTFGVSQSVMREALLDLALSDLEIVMAITNEVAPTVMDDQGNPVVQIVGQRVHDGLSDGACVCRRIGRVPCETTLRRSVIRETLRACPCARWS